MDLEDRTNTVGSYLYKVSTIVKFLEAESRMVVARGGREGRCGVANQ